MDCNSCKQSNLDVISVAAHETAMAREDRKQKRLLIALIVSIVLGLLALVGTNVAWLVTWNNYDFEATTEDIMQDGAGVNIYGSGNRVMQNEPTYSDNP